MTGRKESWLRLIYVIMIVVVTVLLMLELSIQWDLHLWTINQTTLPGGVRGFSDAGLHRYTTQVIEAHVLSVGIMLAVELGVLFYFFGGGRGR